MCIKKGKVIRSEYAETYCSPYYYIQMDDAREFMHNLAGFGHHQVLIFGDYTRLIKKLQRLWISISWKDELDDLSEQCGHFLA